MMWQSSSTRTTMLAEPWNRDVSVYAAYVYVGIKCTSTVPVSRTLCAEWCKTLNGTLHAASPFAAIYELFPAVSTDMVEPSEGPDRRSSVESQAGLSIQLERKHRISYKTLNPNP